MQILSHYRVKLKWTGRDFDLGKVKEVVCIVQIAAVNVRQAVVLAERAGRHMYIGESRNARVGSETIREASFSVDSIILEGEIVVP